MIGMPCRHFTLLLKEKKETPHSVSKQRVYFKKGLYSLYKEDGPSYLLSEALGKHDAILFRSGLHDG